MRFDPRGRRAPPDDRRAHRDRGRPRSGAACAPSSWSCISRRSVRAASSTPSSSNSLEPARGDGGLAELVEDAIDLGDLAFHLVPCAARVYHRLEDLEEVLELVTLAQPLAPPHELALAHLAQQPLHLEDGPGDLVGEDDADHAHRHHQHREDGDQAADELLLLPRQEVGVAHEEILLVLELLLVLGGVLAEGTMASSGRPGTPWRCSSRRPGSPAGSRRARACRARPSSAPGRSPRSSIATPGTPAPPRRRAPSP